MFPFWAAVSVPARLPSREGPQSLRAHYRDRAHPGHTHYLPLRVHCLLIVRTMGGIVYHHYFKLQFFYNGRFRKRIHKTLNFLWGSFEATSNAGNGEPTDIELSK
jgi:hypothetical protein